MSTRKPGAAGNRDTMKTRLGLYVTERRSDGWYYLSASIVTIGTTASDRRAIDGGERTNIPYQKIRNPNDYGMNDDTRGLYLCDLKATATGKDDDDSTPGAVRHLYGWVLEYRDLFSVDRRKAERMSATLATIDRRLEKQQDKYGPPATFGAYLLRVAAAIDADAIVIPAPGPSRGWSYDDHDHQIHDLKFGMYAVDGKVRAWVNERERQRQERERAAQAEPATVDE